MTVTDSTGTALSASLSGTGIVVGGVLGASPGSLDFGAQAVGATTQPQTVTLTNNGNAASSITSIVSSNAAFVVTGIALPFTLSPSQSVTFGVTFTPSSATAFSGTLTINSTANNAPQTVVLSGTGVVVGGVLSVNPTSLAFGSQAVGATTPAQTVTVTNSASGNATITSIVSSNAAYVVTGIALPFTLNPTQSVQFGVTFTPTSAATFPGLLTISSTANNSPQILTLSGTGVVVGGVFTVSPTSLAFGTQSVGATTQAQTVTVTNTGTTTASIISITSSNAAYSVTNITFPFALSPTQSVQFGVTFSPSSVTSFPGTLTISSTASNSPQTVTLSGDGVAPAGVLSASPGALNFGQQSVGASSS
ncbi:MAG TPA: choice-of-anchor D domain-containing protein, partial [Candidatus Acidoferrales bacterium]|nr:choice-of-anchor D domain-containing protein [Candidatus Acidoferrales bacterium]